MRRGIALNVEHVPGARNPADKYTVERGFLRWQDCDLASLAEPVESAGGRECEGS